MEKNADNKKSKRKKNEKWGWQKKKINKETNKQTNKQRKEICHMVGPLTYIQNMMPIVGTVL